MNTISARTLLLLFLTLTCTGFPGASTHAADPTAEELKEAVRHHANVSTWTFGDKVGSLAKLDLSLDFISTTWLPAEESAEVALQFRPSAIGKGVLALDVTKPRPLWTYRGKWKCTLGGVIGFRKWKVAADAGSYEAKQPFAGLGGAPAPK